MALTKHDFFNALHVFTHLKERVRYNGKIISMILIDEWDPDTWAADFCMDQHQGKTINEEYYREQLQDAKVFVSTVPYRKRQKEDWIEITPKELDVLYQQVLSKVGSVDEDDLGEIKKLF